jgi:membrane protease YdiL (CAAX protease family)
VLAPLMEEMTYRGVLHGALRNRLGGIATVPVGSAIFAVAHLSGLEVEVDRYWVVAGISMLQIFLFALVLGWLRERDRRIGRAFFAHGAWNAINLIAILSLPYLEG